MTLPTLSIASLFKYSALISMGILLPFMILISVCVVAFLRKKMSPDTHLLVPVIVSLLSYGAIIVFSTARPFEELGLLVLAHAFAWVYLARRRSDKAKGAAPNYRRVPVYPSKMEPVLNPIKVQR